MEIDGVAQIAMEVDGDEPKGVVSRRERVYELQCARFEASKALPMPRSGRESIESGEIAAPPSRAAR